MDGTDFVEAMLPPRATIVISLAIPLGILSRQEILTEFKQSYIDGPANSRAFIEKYNVKQWSSFEDAFANAPITHHIWVLDLT